MGGQVAEHECYPNQHRRVVLVLFHCLEKDLSIIALHQLLRTCIVNAHLRQQPGNVHDQLLVGLEAVISVDVAELGQDLAVNQEAVGLFHVSEVSQGTRDLNQDHGLLVLVLTEGKSC